MKKEFNFETGEYSTRELTQEEINELQTDLDAQKEITVRQERNNLLKNSDWTQLVDSPADKAAWAAYRQALRDIPAQAGFPGSVEFPDEP